MRLPGKHAIRILATATATAMVGVLGLRSHAAQTVTPKTISLAGPWRFRLDPENVGLEEKWIETDLPNTITLPGSTDEGGYGSRTTQKDIWQLTRVCKYVGPAWYQRDIIIPDRWHGKRITLFLERCHWETRVWVDDKAVGTRDSLSVPHVYDLSESASPGQHRLTIRVDNSSIHNIGEWCHAVTETTQTNWNGIIGRIALAASDPVWVESVQVYPDLKKNTADVVVTIGNRTGQAGDGTLTLLATPVPNPEKEPNDAKHAARTASTNVTIGKQRQMRFTVALPMGSDMPLWDEFFPTLFELTASLCARVGGESIADAKRVSFGMREFRTSGTQFVVNGRPTFLRGTLECCIFPRTGYPPMDVEAWGRIFRIARSYGLNHIRFHSWCPPEAAFAAADRAGFMLHVETPLWIDHWMKPEQSKDMGGWGAAPKPFGQDPKVVQFIEAEFDRILDLYGNHPSFCMLCMGNEIGGDFAVLERIIQRGQRKDPRHMYSCSTARNHMPADDFYVTHQSKKGPVRGLRGGSSTDWDFRSAVAPVRVPIVSHEIGQWAVYPNFDEMKKYTGHLRPRSFEVFRDDLAAHHMLDQAGDFVRASGALAVLLYKEEMEAALRTPGLGGFQLLDLHDFPGQGTALVGILDAFWDSKGLITPGAFRRFCSPTVPLLRMKKRTWTADETFTAEAEIAHFGAAPLQHIEPAFLIADANGRKVAAGAFSQTTLPVGKLTGLGNIAAPLRKAHPPEKLTVTISVDGTDICNTWDIWVYPAGKPPSEPDDVLVIDAWNDLARGALASDKRVLLLPTARALRHSIAGRFTTVFWGPIMFKNQIKTMGILCDPAHPALAQFPTDFHTNWQWWDPINVSRAMILDDMPLDLHPIVQVIDNFARNHKLGLVFEANVGKGKLLVCSIDLINDLDNRPAARQLRHSLLAYAGSDKFKPTSRLSASALDPLFALPIVRRFLRAPSDVGTAVLNVKAAVHVPQKRSKPWQPDHDQIVTTRDGFGYQVTGGTWRDNDGGAWHGPDLAVTVTCPKGFAGTLFAHFHDWNRLKRAASLCFEGKYLGELSDYDGKGQWLALPVAAEDSADGKLELKATATAGPNAQITQIVLMPKAD